MPNPDTQPDIAQWTFMLYMAGDNNLAGDCVRALLDLKNNLDPNQNDVHVIAQFDPSDPRISSRRLVINRKNKKKPPNALVTNTVGVLDDDRVLFKKGSVKFDRQDQTPTAVPHNPGVLETDSSDPETLFDFISWSAETFPAKRYMLILAGHSAGVEDGFLLKDEHPPNAMQLEGLAEVLRQTQDRLHIKMDILGMDSCLMGMAEICLELQDKVDVFVGSQSMTPNPGWPYGAIVQKMQESKGNIEAELLAKEMVHAYISSYVDQAINSGTSTDLAALKVDKSANLATKVRELAGALLIGEPGKETLRPIFKRHLVFSHWQAQSYNGELFVDLADFCNLLIESLGDGGQTDEQAITTTIEKCKGVLTAISEMVLESCFCGIDFQYSHGLSIYFPWSLIFFDYSKLVFAQDQLGQPEKPDKLGANWYQFLKQYVQATRRRPRGERQSDDLDTEVISRVFEVRDFNFFTRKVEPFDHGPSGGAQSMRNPPMTLPRHMIKGFCTIVGDLGEVS